MQIVLTSEILLAAYSQGLFPMAERADSPDVHWYCPEKRGQLSIEGIHISRTLKKKVRQGDFDIRINTDFRQVIESCCLKRPDRPETWINKNILDAFCKLHEEGQAHSVECWLGSKMVGGLYGLSIGGAFFGESMFSRVSEASKVCLVHLVARLWVAGYQVLDTQFVNPHLQQFGVFEISYKTYLGQLTKAVNQKCSFQQWDESEEKLVRLYFEKRKETL